MSTYQSECIGSKISQRQGSSNSYSLTYLISRQPIKREERHQSGKNHYLSLINYKYFPKPSITIIIHHASYSQPPPSRPYHAQPQPLPLPRPLPPRQHLLMKLPRHTFIAPPMRTKRALLPSPMSLLAHTTRPILILQIPLHSHRRLNPMIPIS